MNLILTIAICVTLFTSGLIVLRFAGMKLQGTGDLAGGIVNSATVLFQMLDALPYGSVTSVIAILLLIVFIVTSADSGALVVDTITSGGKTDAPVAQRVFWACMLGLTASALLYGGGTAALESLQAGTITAALPFTVVLLICCLSLYLGMRDEHLSTKVSDKAAPPD